MRSEGINIPDLPSTQGLRLWLNPMLVKKYSETQGSASWFRKRAKTYVFAASGELVSSYVKFVTAMGENTPSWRHRVRLSWGSVILRNGTKKCTECLDVSHQYRLQSKQIQSLCQMYSRFISPGERLQTMCKEICFAEVVRNANGSSAHSVWKV